MQFRLIFLVLFIMLSIECLKAQDTKTEKEEKVSVSEVPALSTDWLGDVFPKVSRLKWYKEVTSGVTSFEAKFKWGGKKHSVEFSEEGTFEDIEFIIRWKSLVKQQRESLLSGMVDFENIKVKKIQEQWTATNKTNLQEAVKTQNLNQGVVQKYELIIQAKKGDKTSLWEVLITPEGKVEEVKEVVLRSTVNLDF